MNSKKLLLVTAFCAFVISGFSQDYRFSQFYNSPLTLNPALAGKVNGGFRVAFNYRNQWFNATDDAPYLTYAGSIDFPIVLKNDALGIGISVVNDQTGGGIYNHTTIMGNFAYHKSLSKDGKHSLSLGVQLGYAQRNLDQNDLRFFNQFDGQGFNTTISPNEDIVSNRSDNFDFNVGLLYNGIFSEKVNFYGGFSMFHVIEPKNSFLDGSEFADRRRYVAHVGAEFKLNEVLRLIPSIIYMRQSEADEFYSGLSLGFFFDQGVNLYAGGYYRATDSFGASDAAIVYGAFEIKQLRVGISYDATVSSLNDIPRPTGSFELSLIWIGKPSSLPYMNSLLFCPRF